MELTYQFDGVGHLPLAVTAEEFADGDIGRAPKRLASQTCQVLIEEKRCPLVGEDNDNLRQVGTVFPEQIGCDVFEKGFHSVRIMVV